MTPLTDTHRSFESDETARVRMLVAPMAGGRTTAALVAAETLYQRLDGGRRVYYVSKSHEIFSKTALQTHKALGMYTTYGLYAHPWEDPWPTAGIFICEDFTVLEKMPTQLRAAQYIIATESHLGMIPLWLYALPATTIYVSDRVKAGAPVHHLPPDYYDTILKQSPQLGANIL